MTEPQDVLEHTRPRRRHAPALLLGGLPVAIASTALVGAFTYAPGPPVPAPVPSSPAVAEAPTFRATVAAIAAPDVEVDLADSTPRITVKVPPPPEPAAPAASNGRRTSSGGTTQASSSRGFAAYCASPSSPAVATSVEGLLGAANAERARLGYAPLSWSGSLASAATAWSQHLAAADEQTSEIADQLAHNPHRPGAENVAMVYRSTGYARSTAIAKMHVNWMYSPGHCANIMNPAYTQMGAGAASTSDGTTWYATENFR